ncbi:MAG: cadherin-like domain-containing protein, partial [Planctomycetes bacterium]|nr:cadherin-like domain-containing protein [Planctomycetota bacterium]
MLLIHWLNGLRREAVGRFLWRKNRGRRRLDRRRLVERQQWSWNTEALEDRTLLSAPTALDDSFFTQSDTTLLELAPGVLQNDNDPESDPLEAVLEVGPANGVLTLGLDGGFTYPNPGFVGTDTFTYRADDGLEQSNIATVAIDVGDIPGDELTTARTVTLNLNSEIEFAAYIG